MRSWLAGVIVLVTTAAYGTVTIRHENGIHLFPDGITTGVLTADSISGSVSDPSVINVKAAPYNATGNCSTDDSAAINAALQAAKAAGGGAVFLPAATCYKLDAALVIPSNVELFGAGNASLVKRSATPHTETTSSTDCVTPGTITNARFAIINELFNCGDTGIKIHDLAFDGSLITSMPCTSCAGGPTNPSVTIDLSALVNSDIYNLTLTNVPQDGIFVKNGGVRVNVHHNTINGCGMLWGNAGCINVEMHTGAGVPANNPGIINISDNYIVANGPDFCDLDLHIPCDSDAICAAGPGGVCGIGAGASNVDGILASWSSDAGGTQPIRGIIARNRLELTDNHIGINTLGMQGGVIVDNRLTWVASATLMSKIYAGINVLAATVTTVRAASDVVVVNNILLGGNVANDRRAIFVDDTQGGGAGSARIKIKNNIITDRNLASAFLGALEFRGVADGEVSGNTVTNITTSNAIVIGATANNTADALITGNIVGDVNTAGKDAIALKNTLKPLVSLNAFRNVPQGIEAQSGTVTSPYIGPNTYDTVTTPIKNTGGSFSAPYIYDAVGASFTQANLPTAANGSRVFCSNCNTDGTCTGGGGGAVADRNQGSWVCTTTGAQGANRQVQYNNSGALAGDANFIWHSTNQTIGLGGFVNPAFGLSIQRDDNTNGQFLGLDYYSTGNGGEQWTARRSGGSIASPAAVTSTQVFLALGADGRIDASNFSGASKVSIDFLPTENWSSGNNGTAMDFNTTANTTSTRTRRMRIADDGEVLVNTTTKDGAGAKVVVADGHVAIKNTDNTARAMRIYEPSGSGANFTGFLAQAQGADITYTFPTAQGAAGTTWFNDGTGLLTWVPHAAVHFGTDGVTTTIATGTNTYFAGLSGAITVAAGAENLIQSPSAGGTYRNLRCTPSATPGGSNIVITLRSGACGSQADSTVTVTVTTANTTVSDTTHSVAVTAGQCVDAKIVGTATTTAAAVQCVVEW